MAEIEDIMRSDPPTFRFTTALAGSLRTGLHNHNLCSVTNTKPDNWGGHPLLDKHRHLTVTACCCYPPYDE